ncbi:MULTISPECIES: molecular chaperone [Enterobacteriaceae]|uniref:Molecular chaperone n=1 Tax=Raoultella lignicola TaxID=3040939 RepID=A0ABU9FA75_9ENTR|nr:MULTISPECIES: molecular chaperone [Enterobacteriaceae]MRT51798.1 fimbria/pilus periplasmic chaperone [Raoultella sp. RIT712]QNK06401.1 molecular chaperone [Enterobacter sp. JUb54]ROS07282.1 P pilus assembly chaperone PapD [Raoultella sp. BIGb0399]
MNSVMKKQSYLSVRRWLMSVTCGLLLAAAVDSAWAGVALDRTRLIINENDRSVSANLSNTSPTTPFLAQSWVEDASGAKVTSPLMVLPPLQRINGGQKGIARVTKTSGITALPQDRESLFYLNVREIPPKPDKPNVLQLAMQSRIKLFYRPSAIVPPEPGAVWQNQVVFHKKGRQWSVENPTPYFVTVIGLSRKPEAEGSGRLTDFPGMMVAPKSSMDFKVTDASISQFTMMYVNDFGGHPELKYRCTGDTCRALPAAQQPR